MGVRVWQVFEHEESVKKIVRVGEPSRVYLVIDWVAVVWLNIVKFEFNNISHLCQYGN